jgi:hypothetical protein
LLTAAYGTKRTYEGGLVFVRFRRQSGHCHAIA